MEMSPYLDPMRSVLYQLGGWASLGLGVVGAFVPGLPTTPFVLLSSWLFYRSSPRAHAWLRRSRLFGGLIHDWETRRGVRRRVKVRAVTVIVAVAAASFALSSLHIYGRVLVLGLSSIGLFVMLRLPTLPDEDPPPAGPVTG
ncbi:MAG: YbaN family protein [Planctomycetia bacterium]